ncbi:hypothetical protein NDU88_004289 [Pleurodeles waltl]|uniref:Uncharacterized protein n=1 Tax=Pleurodeles waltl TaxID=8319 RepID=A0AAV7RGV0_PLEWA|nr:hypothetical protein NDU88_004289 [Pleurodeles waltl]
MRGTDCCRPRGARLRPGGHPLSRHPRAVQSRPPGSTGARGLASASASLPSSRHLLLKPMRLPVVALGPEPSGLGPTRAFTRIHAGAPAQLGRPPLRRPYRGPKRKKARGGD